jgi:phosphoribosyl-ATP pyrophosphohydrolase/phosphoribosyl-AMP cyclohydrolase
MTRRPTLRYNAKGLVPAIIQDAATGEVLTLAYMNAEAFKRTLATGQTHFWSRSRNALWHKGATSGNVQTVRAIRIDCDADTVLITVDPAGPACHTGARSCFARPRRGAKPTIGPGVLEAIYRVILERKRRPRRDSYVAALLAKGPDAILKKIAEESGEVILSAKNRKRGAIVWEVADLWFHTLVMLGAVGIPPSAVFEELNRRAAPAKTASRRGGQGDGDRESRPESPRHQRPRR